MKSGSINWITILIITIFFASCRPLAFKMYGIKKSKTVTEKEIIRYEKKYNIPVADGFRLDSSYEAFLNSLNKVRYKAQRKNHLQPLQALYYNQEGQLQSFHINCYTVGFPNLNWNIDGTLNTFPPKQQAPIDSILPLGKHLEYLEKLPSSQSFQAKDFDYVVMVYWCRTMGRQSKRLVRAIQKNVKLVKGLSVKTIYVNTDSLIREK